MISIEVILALIAVHYVADFIMQTRWIGNNKSGSNWILSFHVLLYTAMLVPFGVTFAILNGVLHFLTDYCSSRMTGKFYHEGRMYAFWNTIGGDQAVHMATLMMTYVLLEGKI